MRRRNRAVPDWIWAYAVLLLMTAGMGVANAGTLEPRHLLDLVRQAAPLGIVAIGQTLLLMCAQIDLSLGTQITLYNVVLSTAMRSGDDNTIAMAVVMTTVVAVVAGLANALAVTRLHIPAFVATLASSSVFAGAYLLYTKGAPSGSIAQGFRVIAEERIADVVPWPAVIWLVAAVAVAFLLNRARFGRELVAVGGNPQASYLSGLNVERTIVLCFVVASLLAALASAILSAYIGIASNSVGDPYTLNSIAATVIGGTAFTGGEGTIAGTVAGALLITVLQAILTMFNTGDSAKLVAQGIIILAMMTVYQWRSIAQGLHFPVRGGRGHPQRRELAIRSHPPAQPLSS
jgi:ribose/xylose/arabinose/galactoside ABC-type transport system permease subunit